MSSPKKYDPPEAVVGPAFSELLDRLARSRVHVTGGVEMSDEERKIFDYGVSERKRVLEHTLFLVFGQWAVYRQLVSRLQSRGLRIAYGASAVLTSGYFLGARAKRVSHEMFATIATTATTSPLGNEARVVLAELEGPDGPYFRRICHDKNFAEDLPSVIAALDEKDGVDPASDHLHPQLRLRPRLPVPAHPQDEVVRGARPRDRRDLPPQPPRDADFRAARVQRGRAWVASEGGEAAGGGARPRREALPRDPREPRERGEARGQGRETRDGGREDELWGKPFDFKAAATGRAAGEADGDSQDDRWVMENTGAEGKAAEMTPSQRRAAERQQRRLRARTRSDGTDR